MKMEVDRHFNVKIHRNSVNQSLGNSRYQSLMTSATEVNLSQQRPIKPVNVMNLSRHIDRENMHYMMPQKDKSI